MEFEQLLQRAKESDEWAFEQIFKMYRPLLLKQAIGDNGLDEDLYQELYKTFLNCIDKFLIDVTEKGPKRD